MIKIEKVSYKALKKISVMDRLKMVSDPGVGNTLMSALTPTQMAELFPSYYRKYLPDISGFQKAIPSAALSAKQQWYDEQIQGAVKGDKAGANLQPTLKKNESTWEKVKRKAGEAIGVATGAGKPLPKPQLTPNQMAAIEDLKKGNIAVDDPRVKFMAGLTNAQLVQTGIQKIKDEKSGKEVFNYTPPSVSAEEAEKSLREGTGKWKGGRFSAANYAGALRQAGFQEKDIPLMTAVGIRESNHDVMAANDKNPHKERSYGLFQVNLNAHPFGSPELNYAGIHSMEDLHDPVKNAKVAYYLYYKTPGGIRHWGAYTDGGYKQYVQEAQAGAASDSGYSRPAKTDPLTGKFTDVQISAEQRRLVEQQELGRLGSLAEFTSATPQELTRNPNIKNATTSGSTDFASLSEQATKIGQLTHPGFSIRNDGKGGMCGVGAHSFAGAMFGSEHFNKGLGGHAHTLSTGNGYFQSSGFYSNPIPPKGDLTDKAYLDSLPVGTVISAEGGGRGLGHVQIKTGPGQWASDFGQGNKVLLQSHGVSYYNQQVHIPNERGMQVLAQRGFPVTSPTAATESAVKDPTPPGAAPNVESIQSVSTPQQQVLTRDTHIVQPQPAAPPSSPAQVEAAKPSGPQPAKYNVNHAGFIAAIKNTPDFKNNPLSFMATEQMIIDGFNDDPSVKAAGVRYDAQKGIMTFRDSNHPDVKKIMSDMHTDSFMKKIEEKKKEEQKKTEVKPGEVKTEQKPAAAPPTASVTPTPSTEIKQATEGKGEGGNSAFDIDRTMAMIRRQESGSFGGNYSADAHKKSKSTASGAYQFNNKTWAAVAKQHNIGTEYKRAVDAPREVQDALMRARLEALYAKHGSLEKVLMTHFTGNAAGKMSASAIRANGGLTGPQYVASIIQKHGPEYDKMKAGAVASQVAPTLTGQSTPSAMVNPQATVEKANYTPPSTTTQPKVPSGPMGPAVSPEIGGVKSDIHALREEMNTKFADVQHTSRVLPQNVQRTVTDRDPNMINNLTTATAKQYSNPTAERALGSRPHFAETGGPTAHFSGGNNVG